MKTAWTVAALAAAGLLVSACGGAYVPSTPRYATRLDQAPPPPPPQYPTTPEAPVEPESEAVLPPAPSTDVDAVELAPLGPPPPPPASTPLPPPPPPAQTPPLDGAPVRPGAVYVIQGGDTLSGVARRFGTPVRTLMTLNGIGEDGSIRLGMRLILPEGARDGGTDPYATGPSPFQDTVVPEMTEPAAPPPPPPPPPPASTPVVTPPPPPSTGASLDADGFPTAAELVRRAQGRFAWPVRGDLLTRFGTMGSGLRSDGINIGADAGTEVRAAAAGQVAYAGSSLPGLGTTVVIVHSDGWVTAYSHLGSTNVRMEQRVTQGQVIGITGTTGGVTQPQVHFEIRYTPAPADRPRPVDPIPLLPR